MVASATRRARQAGTAPDVDLRPQPREAVAQLEGVADELLRRRGRDPQDGAELGDAELRHQRAALAGDGLLVLAAGDGERGRGVDRLGRVEVGPPGSDLEELGGGLVLGGLAITSQREQVGGREVVFDPLAHLLQRFDHVF